MNARRLLAALIRPMLALLLLAGLPVVEPDRLGSAQRLQAVERVLILGAAAQEDAGEWRHNAGSDAERLDGDGTLDAVPSPSTSSPFDRARAVLIGCDFDATAPPTHRPCAAPPTGPPLV